MKYLSLETVVESFKNNTTKTYDGFWGIMAILLSLDTTIIPCQEYHLQPIKIADTLERWFSIRDEYKTYNTQNDWYATFSTHWVENLGMFLRKEARFNKTTSIFDVIAWMYQHHAFPTEPTHNELISLFSKDTSISITDIENLFDTSPKNLDFVDYDFSQKDKVTKFIELYGPRGDNNSLKSSGSYIVSESGIFQRAPFTQTLYASNENFKCLMITSVSPAEYYGDMFTDGASTKNYSIKIDEPLQLIYYGAPGTGKSFKIDGKTNDANSVRTTFHPDSDYASFVGAYKPTMQPMPIHAFVGTTVHHADDANKGKAYERKIVYKYVPQAFLKAYVEAWKDLANPHFLIIEEINRGNCAQIFGDLFQLLDRNSQGASSYAINADEDISQFLRDDENGFAKLPEETAEAIRSFVLHKDNGMAIEIGADILSGKKLLLPPNLYIWATMNTSDQSLFPIDSAFKRRWNWEYIPIRFFDSDPDSSLSNRTFEVGGNRYSWADFLRKINPIISELTESADKQMGFFFAKPDKKSDPELKDYDVISEKVFLNKVLFYLWTDVLKDFNIGREEFKKPDGKNLEFADFFEEGNTYLADFIIKLSVGTHHGASADATVAATSEMEH